MEKLEWQLSGDYAVIRDVTHRFAPRLTKHGFLLSAVSQEVGALLGNRLILNYRFLNEMSKMVILISFIAAIEHHVGGFVILVTTSDNRTVNLRDWLKLNKLEEWIPLLSYETSVADIRVYAESFFEMLCTLFDTKLKNVIDGTEFVETPIDWGGFK